MQALADLPETEHLAHPMVETQVADFSKVEIQVAATVLGQKQQLDLAS
jgi:hypothetical protein